MAHARYPPRYAYPCEALTELRLEPVEQKQFPSKKNVIGPLVRQLKALAAKAAEGGEVRPWSSRCLLVL